MDNENDEKNESEMSDNEEPALDLNINVLQQFVSSRLNRHCVSTRRLTRGLNNEVHLLKFDTGPDCIARLSCDIIHPPEKFISEVATMKYVAQNTNIKIPEVYDWDCTGNNPIKLPYILMERLPGQHLYRVWDELTVEEKKSVLSQIVDTLLELWTKCQFEEIGCLYMDLAKNNSASCGTTSTFRIGPIVSFVFYVEGRDAISSYKGPFKDLQEFFYALIQKEMDFFKIQELDKIESLIKKLDLLQLKLSNIFDELIDQKPFVLIHGDFDAQNILVKRSSINNEIKIVGIIDWEFSRTGTLWNLCEYPIWIQEDKEPFEDLSDVELREKFEKQKLREFFHDEMVVKFGNRSGQILKMKERDLRIEKLETMFTCMIHGFPMLHSLISSFFSHYGSEVANIYFGDPIIDLFWGGMIKVQIPSKETIMHLLSDDELLLNRKKTPFVPFGYIASVYYELKSNGYKISWKQASTIAIYMRKNTE